MDGHGAYATCHIAELQQADGEYKRHLIQRTSQLNREL